MENDFPWHIDELILKQLPFGGSQACQWSSAFWYIPRLQGQAGAVRKRHAIVRNFISVRVTLDLALHCGSEIAYSSVCF
jgi:hypothetical protein